MRRRTKLLAAIAVLIAVVVGGGLVVRYKENAKRALTEVPTASDDSVDDPTAPAESVNEVRLQKLATTSCQCAQKTGNLHDAECWREYKAAVRPFKPGGVAEACVPISAGYDCIATDEGEKCIITEFSIIGSDSFVCTENEARAVESAHSSAFSMKLAQIGGEDIAAQNEALFAADAAAAEIVKRIRRGETPSTVERSGGCGG